ncbi:MAG: error-prone DNA polymerase [Pseudomonadota bacterium]
MHTIATDPPPFAELGIMSNFSFLKGASHPEEIAVRAAKLGLSAFSICDENTLAGSVRGHIAAKEAGLTYHVGCRLVFCDGTPDILIWPKDRKAYGRLCRMLSKGRLREAEDGVQVSSKDQLAHRKSCNLTLDDCLEYAEGSILALVPEDHALEELEEVLRKLTALPEVPRLLLARPYRKTGLRRLADLVHLAQKTGARVMASNLPLYHALERKRLQDVVTAIRHHTTLEKAGRLLGANAEACLKDPAEMARLFARIPEALSETITVSKALTFSLEELRYNYPKESAGRSASPQEELERLTWEGAHERYPDGIPENVTRLVKHELSLIARLNYAPYFLTVHDIVRFARARGILCQGRGSAANSVTCYALGITDVNPGKVDLLFERFISEERREPPDIDVDFEHERREEVIQYVYEKYGRHRAGLAATVITYRARSAIREVGKVFGLSEDAVSTLSATIWGWSSAGLQEDDAKRVGYDPDDPHIRQVMEMTEALVGFPRHLSQHVGGFVMTDDRLDEVVPLQNATMEARTIVEWDKDDLDHLGILKVDVLALGMLSCLRRAFDLLKSHYGLSYRLSSLPEEDKRVYAMISRADTLGVFQIESRAQMSMLPRLRPKTFYDLVIEVAIVRPGPIQGDMVHPYLRRRQGLEKVSYPSEELRGVLQKTLGVPLFQEQAMRIAIVAAGFSPGEADKLRRAMATFRRVGTISSFRQKMIDGMEKKGYERDFAERCFKQIEGFGEYGFPESHAASFALLVYASCWFKCFYPDVFATALLNAQPMGFYAPAQIVRDAKEHGVEVFAPDINHSGWDNKLVEGTKDRRAADHVYRKHADMRQDILSTHAIRLGFRQIKGIGEDAATLIENARMSGAYRSLRDLWLRTDLPRALIERLADADCFRSIGLDRREALWQARSLPASRIKEEAKPLPLFDKDAFHDLQKEPDVTLPEMPLGEQVINDYRYLGLSLKAHPVSFMRPHLERAGVKANATLDIAKDGTFLAVSGLVLVRQRPGSARGVIFQTIEDETGIANIIVWPKTFEKFRPIVMGARFVRIYGKVQKADGVIHVVAHHLEDWTGRLALLSEAIHHVDLLDRADEVKRPVDDIRTKIKPRHKRREITPDMKRDIETYLSARMEGLAATAAPQQTAKVLPKGRNFH